jgi:hypothetical protein
MAPLRTAATTAALRRATQCFVSAGGKSTEVQSVHIKISPSVNPSVFSSRVFGEDLGKASDTSDSNEDYHRSRFSKQNRRFALDHALGLRPSLVSTFYPSLSQLMIEVIVSKKIENFSGLFAHLGDRVHSAEDEPDPKIG